jgi:hypothetical protein
MAPSAIFELKICFNVKAKSPTLSKVGQLMPANNLYESWSHKCQVQESKIDNLGRWTMVSRPVDVQLGADSVGSGRVASSTIVQRHDWARFQSGRVVSGHNRHRLQQTDLTHIASLASLLFYINGYDWLRILRYRFESQTGLNQDCM